MEDAEKRAAESESIRNQRALLLGYAKKQGWAVYDIYADEDYRACERTDLPSNAFLRTRKKENFQSFYANAVSLYPKRRHRAEKYLHALFPLWGFAL